ncbi:carboxypeptidase regulatory-like domain-containing protein [bacterium]|nr:carboxypeptidase regulatory-like domain-containing protein [bacterium]
MTCSLFLGISSIGAYGATPSEIPALPQSPPPKVKYIEQSSVTDGDMSINRGAGWQIVTFSVEQIESVWDLDRMLYRLEGDKYVLVDPVKSPQSLEPGVAYITYFDKPGTVYYRPKSLPYHFLKTTLKDGWNLISYPGSGSTQNIATLTNERGQSIASADLKNIFARQQNSWIDKNTYVFQNGIWKKASLIPGESLSPGEIMTVFANEKITINWNLESSEADPHIFSAQLSKNREFVTVNGENLGSLYNGSLSVAGLPINSVNVIDWQPNSITFNWPGGYQDGALRVCVDGRASNAVYLVAGEQAVKEVAKTNNVGDKKGQGQLSELDDFIETNIAQADATFATATPPQKLVDDPVHFDNINFAEIQEQQEQISQSIKNLEATTSKNGRLMVNRELEANRRIEEARVRAILPEDRGSNLLDYALGPKGSPANLTLSGVVTDNNSRPLDHAKVKLSNGRMTYTDKLGRFSIENLSAGRGSITISKPGYKFGSGKVDLTKGQNEKIRVSLSPESKAPSNYDKNTAQKGNFYVKAYPLKVGPKERRIYVSKIEVWEDGNYSHRWEKTWWEDYDDNYYELRCDDAEIGKIYNIVITWKSHRPGDSGRSDKWTKRFNSRDETFSFDHP